MGVEMLSLSSSEILETDPLTKSMDGANILKIGGQNKLSRMQLYVNGKTTDLVEADKVIEMETLSERLDKIRKEYEAKRASMQSW